MNSNGDVYVENCTGLDNEKWWNVNDNNFGSPLFWSAIEQNKATRLCLVSRNFGTSNGTPVVGISLDCNRGVWWSQLLVG
jgi:hypothetical protein